MSGLYVWLGFLRDLMLTMLMALACYAIGLLAISHGII